MRMNLDASGVEQGVGEINQEMITLAEQIAEVEDGVRNLSKDVAKGEAEKAFRKLNKIVDENVLSIQELGAAADNYKNIALAAGKESPIGQEALKKAADMEKQMDKVNQEVTQLAEGGRALNTTMAIGTGVVASYTAFQSVTALLGEENEELQETFVKLQAAQSALLAVKELSILADKEGIIVTTAQAAALKIATVAQKAYALAVGTGSKAMKIFRLALISTGIGAIVVGLGLLIANFDLVKKKTMEFVDWLLNLNDVILILLGPIGLLILAYKKLFAEQASELSDQEREFQKAMEAENARHKARLEQIEKEKNARIEASDATIKEMKRQIEINQNLGKSVEEETIKMLEAEAEKVRAVRDANIQMLQSHIEHYQNIAKLRGQSEEEFKKSMAAQGIFLDEMYERANEIIAENEQNVELSESRITKFKREQSEKRAEAANEAREKELEEQRKFMENQLALEAKLTELLLANMEEGTEKEMAILMDKHGRERDALIEQFGENEELLTQLEIKQAKELEALLDKINKERLAKEDEYIKQLIDLRIGNMEEGREKELAALKEKHRRELEEIRKKYGEQTELEKELLLKQQAELAAAEAEFNEQDQQAKIAKAEQTLDTIQGYMDQANQINEILNEISDRRIEKVQKERDEDLNSLDAQKRAELSRENLTAEQKLEIEKRFAMQEYQIKKAAAEAEDKIAKRKFNRDKALNLVQIAMDTARGVMGAIASSPPPVNFINAGIVGAIGVAQAAVVASQRFEGTASTISPPSFDTAGSAGAGAGGGGTSGGNIVNPQNNTTTATDPLIEGGQVNQPPIIISQVEINKQQNEIAEIDDVATL